jgi:hypothetical protein
MKNSVKWFGLIVLAAVIGFSFAACGKGNGNEGVEKTITVTDIPSEYITNYGYSVLKDITTEVVLAESSPDKGKITDTSLSMDLFATFTTRFTGSGNFTVSFEIITDADIISSTIWTGTIDSKSITNQNTNISFNEFIPGVVTSVASVTLNQSLLILTAGGTGGTLTADVQPTNATIKNVTWITGNSSVATVTGTGLTVTVNPIGQGTTTISVTTEEGDKTASCSVTVANSDGLVIVPGAGLAEKLTWLKENAATNGDYAIIVNADENILPITGILSYNARTGIKISIAGDTAERAISLDDSGYLFEVGNGVTFTLGPRIKLQGLSNNRRALVRVGTGGTLVMLNGASITGNTNDNTINIAEGGGVIVDGGTFNMNGGEISSNTVTYGFGGGVFVFNGGTFTMNNGSISGNTAGALGNPQYGGGVAVRGGNSTFTMGDGDISANTAWGTGGGLFLQGGSSSTQNATFTMNGGKIAGNEAKDTFGGGGVRVESYGIVHISNGTIYGSEPKHGMSANTAPSGAALSKISVSTALAQYGNGTIWTDIPLDDATENRTTDKTIHVVEGELEVP